VLSFAIIVGCSPESADSPPTDIVRLTTADIESRVSLSEVEAPLSDVRDVAVLPGGFVVVAAEVARVSLFEGSGRWLLDFGSWGEGPGEYKSPTVVAATDSIVYVWDSGSLKLLSYTLDGQFQTETRFPTGVSDMGLEGDKALMYHAGVFDGFVTVADLAQGQIWTFGRPEYEDLLLGTLVGAGKVTLHDGFGWFTRPSMLRLYRVNLDTWSVDSLDFEDSAFAVAAPTHVATHQEIVSKWHQSVAYMSTNSRVSGDTSFAAYAW